MKKLYDLAVKTGSYTDSNGDTKGRYENVGSIMQGDDGNKFMMMKRCFNPAGAPFKEGSDAILISLFEPKAKDGAPRGSKPAQAQPSGEQQFEDTPF